MSKKVSLICPVCGKEFTRYPSQLRTIGKVRVCSGGCRNLLARRAHRESMVASFERRFWERVQKGSGCWHWNGAHIGSGYGTLKRQGRAVLAHRVAYELTKGPIPEGLFLLHRCDNRGCVNPDHLFPGTHQDNMTDMVQKGRSPDNVGEANPRVKLSDETVAEIRTLYATGAWTQAQLGEKYGVHQTQIGRYVREVVRCPHER